MHPYHGGVDDLAGRLAPLVGDDYCYLTTRGRASGRPHEIEIWFALHGTTLFLLAGARELSDWVRNLMADPAVMVKLVLTALVSPLEAAVMV